LTAWHWFRDGTIQGRRIGPHTIIFTEGQEELQGRLRELETKETKGDTDATG
jgi:hypothetical protein